MIRALFCYLILVAIAVPRCVSQDQDTRALPQTREAPRVAKANIVFFEKLTDMVTHQLDQSSKDVKSKADSVPPLKPQTTQTAMSPIDDSDRQLLINRVTEFSRYAGSQEKLYSALALITIVVVFVLALIGSIASFLAKNKPAGILSLAVAAVVGFSNAYPLGGLADFYHSLSAQANALVVDCSLVQPFTTTNYNSDVAQLKLLILYEDKRPGFGSHTIQTDDLIKKLQELKTSTSNIVASATTGK